VVISNSGTNPTGAVERRIQLAVQVAPEHADYSEIRNTWAELDEMGVDLITIGDHFYPAFGDRDGRTFEGMTLLAAMAEVVKTAAIGPFVAAITFRNPNLLANIARTLDHISGGRVVLGIGAGSKERDHIDYGYPWGSPGARVSELERAVPIIKHRLSRLNPPPLGPLPLLIAAGSSRGMRVAAEHADIWHIYAPPAEVADKVGAFVEACALIGRDPDEVTRAAVLGARDRIGDPDEVVASSGATILTYGIFAPFDLGPVREVLAWRDWINARGAQAAT